ncbi:permease-like cell division protein FtsX [Microbispora sp. NPDC049125]|uniref:permease-like cell division protein FtsX n=1 Tax=Microbispora sp. NPDC049125 TaxID=3154929 RepID=UPI0034663D6A
MNDLDELIASLRPDTEAAYLRRRESDLARAFAAPRRRSFFPRLRLAAVAAVPLVLTGVVAAVALAPDPSKDRVVMAASVQQLLSTRTGEAAIMVFLCKENLPVPECGGRTDNSAITEQQKEAVERALTTMTGVKNLTYMDKSAMYDRFLNDPQIGKDSMLRQIMTVEDMTEAFRVTMKPGADWQPVIERAQGMPGVANAVDQRKVEAPPRG